MPRRGEVSAQVFAYAITSVLIVTIFIVGYKYLRDAKGAQESSSLLLLKNSIKNDIARIKNDYGSLSKKEYLLPNDVREVCFVDKKGKNPLLCRGCQKSTDYMDMIEVISNNATSNVFLLDESVKSTLRVDNLKIGCCTFRCFKTSNNRLSIKIEGDGKSALVS